MNNQLKVKEGFDEIMRNNYKDSIGKKFNSLTITDEYKWQSKSRRLVKCICDCGNETWVLFDNITRGHIKSCGCKYRTALGESEGDTTKRFYSIFWNMRNRCNNDNASCFSMYGGRGIKCEWLNYEEFKKDMYDSYLEHVKKHGEKDTTLDRINPNGNYCKDNCRWATSTVQGYNKRNTRYAIMKDGSLKNLKEVSELYNIRITTLNTRYYASKNIVDRKIPIEDLIKDEDIV